MTDLTSHTILNALGSDTNVESQKDVEVEEHLDQPWQVILYDDDIHTFDEVIEQIMKATGCAYSRAQELTFQVHNNGKAIVHQGEFFDCLKIEGVLKEIQLVTEIRG